MSCEECLPVCFQTVCTMTDHLFVLIACLSSPAELRGRDPELAFVDVARNFVTSESSELTNHASKVTYF